MSNATQNSQRVDRRLPQRIATYILGLFLVAISVTLLAHAELGNSVGSGVGYVFSQYTGFDFGASVAGYYSLLLVVQIVLLGKDFQWFNLAQVPFSILYGQFVSFCSQFMPTITFTHIAQNVLMVIVGTAILALGVLLFVGTELVPMPVEGLALAITAKSGIPFTNTKIFVDCLCVCLAALQGLVFFGHFVGLGFGTVFSALATGWIMGKIKPWLPRWMQNWHLT